MNLRYCIIVLSMCNRKDERLNKNVCFVIQCSAFTTLQCAQPQIKIIAAGFAKFWSLCHCMTAEFWRKNGRISLLWVQRFTSLERYMYFWLLFLSAKLFFGGEKWLLEIHLCLQGKIYLMVTKKYCSLDTLSAWNLNEALNNLEPC